jgi:hypothetical protein
VIALSSFHTFQCYGLYARCFDDVSCNLQNPTLETKLKLNPFIAYESLKKTGVSLTLRPGRPVRVNLFTIQQCFISGHLL